MIVNAAAMKTMKPENPIGTSGLATYSAGHSAGVQTSASVDAAEERMDQLMELINRFSPADVMTALRMATTTYLQSEAPASITAAAIELQIARQQPTATTSPIQYSSLLFHQTTSGYNLNISG